MQTHNLGYPRIGSKRELKKACEKFWAGKISKEELSQTAQSIRLVHWQLQKNAGIDLIPSNDFSLYDQVLDLSLVVGAIPERYQVLKQVGTDQNLELYFAMARGYQRDGKDITALEMTKWFDTNYHYLVPEFHQNQKFKLSSNKISDEYLEAKKNGIQTKPVIIGPVSYLLLGKEKETGFNRLDLIQNLLPVYLEIIEKLEKEGAEWIQFDEPFLALDIDQKTKDAFRLVYEEINTRFPKIKILVATYFEGLRDNLETACTLPVTALHLDLVRCPEQLDKALAILPNSLSLSLGVVDGRNVWKNDYQKTIEIIGNAESKIGSDRLLIAPSCSLLHSPSDLDLETNLNPEIKQWLAFARQKIDEVVSLKNLFNSEKINRTAALFGDNMKAVGSKKQSKLIHDELVIQRVANISERDKKRKNAYAIRSKQQRLALNLPLFPTTTIGSFPQTAMVRKQRAKLKKGELTINQYDDFVKKETRGAIRWQEEIGLDVLVHGEFERNDMVEYFGEKLNGFAFTQFGWVQSYGSRCVKPPIIYGDVSRSQPMTVDWTTFAQSLTNRHVKGMLTGPVTILQWSFVRDDQTRSETCNQIALAIRDEVIDLEKAGIKIIQIDEPAFREGLPLRQSDWSEYLIWAVKAFRLASTGVQDNTQIHTHMCYSEFNDIIGSIAEMDADVITMECSRSQMELLDAFADFKYPNEIGPGVYDIHSPRVPSKTEIVGLLNKAMAVIPLKQIWVNPDCGLKTRHWEETEKALKAMVVAAIEMRKTIGQA